MNRIQQQHSPSLKNFLVLSDANIERNVILLGPATEGAEPQDGLLVALSTKILTGTSHEVGMTSVGGISRLESIHGIGTLGLKLLRQLLGSLTPLVQAIIVTDAVQQLDFTTDQVITAAGNVLDVGMAGINNAKHTRNNLLLAVVVHLRITEDGNGLSHLRDKGDGALLGTLNSSLGVGGAGQGDGDGHTDTLRGLTIGEVGKVGLSLMTKGIAGEVEGIDEDGVEVDRLEKGTLPHETLEGCGPALANDLKPIEIDVGNKDLGQSLRLGHALGLEPGGNMQIDHLITVGIGKAGRADLGRTLQDAILLEAAEEHVDALLDLQLVRFEGNLGVERLLVRIIDAGEVLELSGLNASVLALGIALLELVDGNVEEDLVEGDALVLVALADEVAIAAVGGDEADQSDDAGIGEQCGQLTGTADGFGTVGLREGKVTVEAGAEVVSVEAVDVLAVLLHELLLQGGGDGGLAGTGASRHPKGGALLSEGGETLLGGKMAGALVGVGVGLGALNDVRRGGLQGLGAEGAHVDGDGIDETIAVAGLLGVGNGSGGSGSSSRRDGSYGWSRRNGRGGSSSRRGGGNIGSTGRNDGGHVLRGRILLLLLGGEGGSLPTTGTAQHVHNGQEDANADAHGHPLVDELIIAVGLVGVPSSAAAPFLLYLVHSIIDTCFQ